MTRVELVKLFWGKAGPKAKGTSELHPALFHMLDVGMVAQVMAERSPRTALRGLRLAAGLSTDDAARHVGFLVATHDVGKISPGFQEKRYDLIQAQRDRDYPFPPNPESNHGLITQHHLRCRAGKARAAETVARALGAHHGTFHERGPAEARRKDGIGLWQDAREAAIAVLAEIFGVDADAALRPLEFCPSDAMVLAGLTSVADWIGSDKRFFSPEGEQPRPIHAYAEHAYNQARLALSELGWDPWHPDGTVWNFSQLFPEFAPNALQQLTARLAGSVTSPCLVVIEAPMGTGKTEAALHLADVLLNRLGHVGLYDALPTQATSSQMFRRVLDDYLSRRLLGQPANLHLLHGLAAFDDAYAELLEGQPPPAPQPSDISDVDGRPNSPGAAVEAAAWFRGRKLGLLSPFAVGTVDQALQGVLQTRHMFVRLHGLANKVVLVDEAHAYDTYTSTLLNCLLEWLAELGCSVIVLSATLPAAKRRALIHAYTGQEVKSVPGAEYPRITVAVRGGQSTAHSVPDGPEGEVTLEPLPLLAASAREAAVAERLAHELREGGCAAWICNTVDAAQLAYLQLQRLRAEDHPVFHDADLILYHARFPAGDRQQIETLIDGKFGKNGLKAGARPNRAVLIGTQVLEQALDYSVDVMVTELAPIDLVLQRSGRLHRHDHPRPAALEEPRLLWITPTTNEAAEPQFGTSSKIYEEVILLRSWHALRHHPTVRHPRGIEELVEEVYGEKPLPGALQALEERLRKKAEIQRATHERQALANAIYRPTDEDPFRMDRQVPDEEMAADVRGFPGTRLAEPNVTLICAYQRAEGIVLSHDDPRPLDLELRPDRKEEGRLLCRSVRVQNRHWVEHFRTQEPPAGWKESPALRHHRLAVFVDDELAAGGNILRLDPALGLVTSADVLRALAGS